jgi:response regulator RpfG family c-di-GMP phosphodiesterase
MNETIEPLVQISSEDFSNLLKAELMIEHFRKIVRTDTDKIDDSLSFMHQWFHNLDIIDRIDNRIVIIIRYSQLLTFSAKGMYENFFHYLEDSKLLSILIEGFFYTGLVYRTIATVSYQVGIEEIALKYSHQSYDFFVENKNSEEIARALLSLGNSYSLSQETNLQMNYYQKALEISIEIRQKDIQSIALNNIAHTAVDQNNLDLAMISIDQSIELLDNSSSDSNLVGVYLTKAGILNKKRSFDLSEELIKRKILTPGVTREKFLQIECFKILGDIYLEKNEYKESESYYRKGLYLAEEIKSDKYLKEMHLKFSDYYEKIENYEEAFHHFKLYHSYKDKIENHNLKLKSAILKIRYKTKNALKKAMEYKNQKTYLEEKIGEIQTELVDTQKVSVYALATLIEFRDDITGDHVLRITKYVKLLCQLLSSDPLYSSILTEKYIDEISRLSSLHDIGKIAVSDSILRKKGKLDPEEFEIMKQHTVLGKDALTITGGILNDKSFLRTAQIIAYSHHEKWDGTGYPLGLKGSEIPLEGRIVGLVDCFDALISERPYKRAFSVEEAIHIIEEQLGKHFDPVIAKVFLKNIDKFRNISELFSS